MAKNGGGRNWGGYLRIRYWEGPIKGVILLDTTECGLLNSYWLIQCFLLPHSLFCLCLSFRVDFDPCFDIVLMFTCFCLF
jgi:hypothetical protein